MEPVEPEYRESTEREAPPPVRMARLESWVRRLSPWVSLVGSVIGAAYMDRSEDQGGYIVFWAALGFVALVVVGITHRGRANQPDQPGRFQQMVRFTTAATSQSLVQTSLFFSGPFYLEACVFTPAQCLFVAAFVVAIVVSSWDDWHVWTMLHPVWGPALLSFSSFCAWNAALPMLGMPHRRALWWAAGAVSILVPSVQILHGARGVRRLEAMLAGALIPLALAAFGVRALPAAPLKVVDAGIGTGVVDRELLGRAQHLDEAPERLWCLTAISAPRGLSENLLHVWSKDGEELTRIVLTVRGGRKAGFRTWTKLPVPRGSRGVYRCEVRTSLGQTLGVSQLSLGKVAARQR